MARMVEYMQDLVAISQDAPNLFASFSYEKAIVVSGAIQPEFNVGSVWTTDTTGEEELRRNLIEVKSVLSESGMPYSIWVSEKDAVILTEEIQLLQLEQTYVYEDMQFKASKLRERPVRDGVQMERVDSLGGLKQAIAIQIAAFGFNETISATMGKLVLGDVDVTTYILRNLRGQPVSTLMAVRSGAEEGVWNVATYPGYQGMGYGTELLHRALVCEAEKGVETFHLLSTKEGRKMYLAEGFEIVGRVLQLEPMGQHSSGH